MGADLAGGQSFGVQRQHDLIDPGQPALPFLDDLRLERCDDEREFGGRCLNVAATKRF